jgi:hypothetical protein
VWVMPPPVPVIVMVREPRGAVRLTVTVMVDVPEPGAAIELGLKLTLIPLPPPEAVRLMAESKPPDTAVVIVDVPELRLATVIEEGDALMVKLGVAPLEVTVSDTVVVSVVLPEVPVTVMV